MKFKGLYSRWHRFDSNGVKYIRQFNIDEVPNPISQDGYTPWKRGTGPHSFETLSNLRTGVQNACKGKPKTKEQKEKMRQAKLGVPKSPEHRASLKKAWEHRRKESNGSTRTESTGNNIQ